MILKIAYNENSARLVEYFKENFPNLEIEAYNEDVYKERSDAFILKSHWGARETPFAILCDSEDKAIKGFYSEVSECTINNIIDNLIGYE